MFLNSPSRRAPNQTFIDINIPLSRSVGPEPAVNHLRCSRLCKHADTHKDREVRLMPIDLLILYYNTTAALCQRLLAAVERNSVSTRPTLSLAVHDADRKDFILLNFSSDKCHKVAGLYNQSCRL